MANNPLNAVDPLGLWRSDVFSSSLDGSCSINGFIASCVAVMSMAGAGGGGEFGFLCNGCSSSGINTDKYGDPHPFTTVATNGGIGFYYFGIYGDGARELGLPTNLPPGTPNQYWGPFTQGLKEAMKRLKKKKCGGQLFGGGGIGAATMKATEYRFLDLGSPTIGAQTNDASSVFINSSGPYMTYSPVPGQAGPFGRYWTQSQFRAFILLHELGHQLSWVTQFTDDADEPETNKGQSELVLHFCF